MRFDVSKCFSIDCCRDLLCAFWWLLVLADLSDLPDFLDFPDFADFRDLEDLIDLGGERPVTFTKFKFSSRARLLLLRLRLLLLFIDLGVPKMVRSLQTVGLTLSDTPTSFLYCPLSTSLSKAKVLISSFWDSSRTSESPPSCFFTALCRFVADHCLVKPCLSYVRLSSLL